MPEKPFLQAFSRDFMISTENMAEIAVFADFPEDFHWTFSLYFVVFSHKNNNDIAFSFFRSFAHLFARSFVCLYFHYQVGPISMWLVCCQFLLVLKPSYCSVYPLKMRLAQYYGLKLFSQVMWNSLLFACLKFQVVNLRTIKSMLSFFFDFF